MRHRPVLVRGGGDLASGVVLRLHHAGFSPIITEISRPLAVRRWVAFSEAVYDGRTAVEGLTGLLVARASAIEPVMQRGEVPVLVDPDLEITAGAYERLGILAVVDARLTKRSAQPLPFGQVIGLGPGFTPGVNCTAVVETMRGHTLGRVYRDRPAAADTGLPDGDPARVLRAPESGILVPAVEIGDQVSRGDLTAEVVQEDGRRVPVAAGVSGVVRGMIRPGLHVAAGIKIGDIDGRSDPALCALVSDKALAVAGGVLEALLGCLDLDIRSASDSRDS